MVDDSTPETSEVEILALEAAKRGRPEHDALINTFLDAVAVVPTASDPAKGAIEPVLIEIDGVTHMLVCDSLAAVRGEPTSQRSRCPCEESTWSRA